MASTAVGLERIARTIGWNLKKGSFQESSPNLPQRIAIFAEANFANQETLNTNAKEITSAKQAGELYGYGSPIHMIMRILRPFSGDGVGGIPTIVYPQAQAPGASARVVELTVAGTPTKNGTHYVVIGGRTGIDGSLYAINITTDDNAATIHQKIEDAVNNVLACPMTADSIGGYEVQLTTKWKGATAQGITVSVDTGEDDLGLTYAVNELVTGSGVPSISGALAQFGNIWNTWVINSYGTNDAIMDALEAFNGIPLNENPTGRYSGTQWKPFIALTGSVADDPSTITDLRPDDVTIAICPAPLSPGAHFEAAANMCRIVAPIAQNTPHLDAAGLAYPDMPVPSDGAIGSMEEYNNRDLFVQRGCSTVILVNGRYQVEDFVTTYYPEGEIPPQHSYVRDLVIDMNVRYRYMLKEQIHVIDHAIANDNDVVSATKVVKPKQWKGIIATELGPELVSDMLVVDLPFLVASIQVNIGENNPNRFETSFRYKRSGFVRISSSTAEAGYNFGTLTT